MVEFVGKVAGARKRLWQFRNNLWILTLRVQVCLVLVLQKMHNVWGTENMLHPSIWPRRWSGFFSHPTRHWPRRTMEWEGSRHYSLSEWLYSASSIFVSCRGPIRAWPDYLYSVKLGSVRSLYEERPRAAPRPSK